MHDVIGAYQRIDHIYKLYIRSAFPMRYRVLAEEREKILSRPGLLSQPRLIEPVPVYKSSGKNLIKAAQDLPGYEDLVSLGQTLFPSGLELYQHQWESLEAVCKNGQDIVVTTGTGSGKTECFLLPLLAQLAKESQSWEECPLHQQTNIGGISKSTPPNLLFHNGTTQNVPKQFGHWFYIPSMH
ncbi:DEAD/DEAH box helicase [Synechocystis sp. B12]|nr:DEAD/DEAH box helicase [Synechocystis sp. B12]